MGFTHLRRPSTEKVESMRHAISKYTNSLLALYHFKAVGPRCDPEAPVCCGKKPIANTSLSVSGDDVRVDRASLIRLDLRFVKGTRKNAILDPWQESCLLYCLLWPERSLKLDSGF